MANFAARVSQGHIGRAKYLATNETVRSNRKLVMQLPLQLGSLAAAFHAAKILVDLATQEANTASEERDVKEIEKLQEAYGKGATGRGMATGGAKSVKELEKEQKSRSTRMVRDSIDGALLEIATFYRDVMMVQSGNAESIINADMNEQIASYASTHSSHSTILKINAIMEVRSNLAYNASPLVTCEALMCRLAKS
jgi:DNA polymerase-3 subunit delta'